MTFEFDDIGPRCTTSPSDTKRIAKFTMKVALSLKMLEMINSFNVQNVNLEHLPYNKPEEPLHFKELEIKVIDKLNEEDPYLPMPKKGIAQKAQWANKPYKRKHK